VADPDFSARVSALSATLTSITDVIDLDAARREIAELEQQASDPNLWDDQERAQQVTSRLSFLQNEVRRVEQLRSQLDDVLVLFELAETENDQSTAAEATAELDQIAAEIAEMEVRTLLSGDYDQRGALIHVHSGAGGVDAADWAQMLLRMYTR